MKVKIGELAKMVSCKVVTIRFYEKEGLLKEPDRPEPIIGFMATRRLSGYASSGIVAVMA